MTAATMGTVQAPARETSDTAFMWMALGCVAIAFGGFAGEYWAPTLSGRLVVPPIMHIHGAFASAWTIYLFVQAALIAQGRRIRHRELGLLGVALATAVTITGLLMVIRIIINDTSHGYGEDSKTFSIVSIPAVVFFAGFVGVALAYAKRREVHKRLMLLATIGILEAPIGRIFKLFLAPPEVRAMPLGQQPPPPLQLAMVAGGVVDLLIIAAAVYDWRTRGKLHPVWLWGGLTILVLQAIRLPVGPTPAWHALVDGLVRLAG